MWDELDLTSSANKSFCFQQYLPHLRFFNFVLPMFWEMENQNLIWWNAKKCSCKPFLSISNPKNGLFLLFLWIFQWYIITYFLLGTDANTSPKQNRSEYKKQFIYEVCNFTLLSNSHPRRKLGVDFTFVW